MPRPDGRVPGALRPLKLTRGVMRFAHSSCLVEWGKTKVLCTATVEESVPPFLKGKGTGWVTGEYAMLPGSSSTRIPRERSKLGGRTQEIQRLIGRSLRAVTRLKDLGERSVLIDCDVMQADGGTRCAAITGGVVALAEGLRQLGRQGTLRTVPLTDAVAAVSVGLCRGIPVLDMDYAEDSTADVDMNVVATGGGALVEVQGTAERRPFSHADLNRLLGLATRGLGRVFAAQRAVLRIASLRQL